MARWLLLALLVLSVPLSLAVNSVTGCMDITNNTDPVYQLANSLSGANQSSVAGPACVRISVSNIELDCNGFGITNNGTAGLTIAIHPNTVSNVTVRNCPSLSGYEFGVYAFGTNGSLFTNITAFNDTDGIFLGSFSDNNTVANSTAHGNSNGGISVGSADNNSFTGNDVYNNSYGFIFDTNAGNVLSGNNAHNNAHGYRITASNFTTLTGNVAANNSDNGIWLESSMGSLADSNNATGNGGNGFFLSTSLFGSPGLNTLTDNIASGNGGDGFELSFADGNTIDDNIISGNSGAGLFVSLSSNNNFSGNSISGGTFGINLFSGSTNDTFTGNSISGTSSNAVFSGNGNTFIDNNASNCFGGFSLGANNVLSGNTISGVAAFGGFRLESASHNNVLTDNTVFSSNRGLEIAGANNTTVTNMHLYNNSFEDFLTDTDTGDLSMTLSGIVFDSPSGSLSGFTNLSISDVLENGTGYSISHSANPGSGPSPNHVSFADKFVAFTTSSPVSIDSISWHWDDSELTSFNENNFELWKLNGSTWTLQNDTPDTGANTLSLTSLSNFSVFGIFDSASNVTDCLNITSPGNYVLANDLSGASINGSPQFSGLACIRISSSDVLLDCNGFSITGNFSGVTGGIITEGPGAAAISGVSVQNCAVSNYTQGIVVINTDSSSFLNNTASDNSFNGISARGGSTGNTYSSNTVFGNNAHGFELSDNADSNLLDGNVAHDNSGDGFNNFQTDGNSYQNNTAYNNSYGIFIFDSNNTAITNDHYYGNIADFGINGSGIQVDLSGVAFDSAGGNFSDYTSLSLSDLVESAYSIDHAAQPASLPFGRTSFAAKFVNISNLTANVSLDSITWHWLDSELSNTSNESKFELWKHNGTWSQLNATLDTTANTLSLADLDSFSVFAVLQNDSPPLSGGDSDGGSQGEDQLSISLAASCDANTVTVTDGGSPVAGAEVRVDGDSIGTTNGSGQVSFAGCGKAVIIRASRAGFDDAVGNFGLASCECTQCAADSDCAGNEMCSNQQCVLVPCSCGQVLNHACVAFQCCFDADCGADEVCERNVCKPKTEGCSSDLECADNQYCDIPPGQNEGACKEVAPGACGEVKNHAFVPYGYECGTEPGCPACPAGYSCLGHECVQNDVSCPGSGAVGSQITCTATTDGKPCAFCDVQVTGPDGSKSGIKTAENGEFRLPLLMEGTYRVALLKDGSQVKLVQVDALPRAGGEGPQSAQEGSGLSVLWLLLLLLVAVGAILYWRSRAAKK